MIAITQTTQTGATSPQWNSRLRIKRKIVPRISIPMNNPKAVPQIIVAILSSIIFVRIVIYLSSSEILSSIPLFDAQSPSV